MTIGGGGGCNQSWIFPPSTHQSEQQTHAILWQTSTLTTRVANRSARQYWRTYEKARQLLVSKHSTYLVVFDCRAEYTTSPSEVWQSHESTLQLTTASE